MFTTITLNPCIDKTIFVPCFKFGDLNHISRSKMVIAGKGFNVSKGIARLGFQTIATGFLYSSDSKDAIQQLENEVPGKITVDCIVCPGHLRVNTKVFDEQTRTVTGLNEPGVETNENYVSQIIEKVGQMAALSNFLIMSGSLPPKCPQDIYLRIIKHVLNMKVECKIVLDASGAALAAVFENNNLAMPYLIKPNRDEFCSLINKTIDSIDDFKSEAIKLIHEKGIKIICISLDSQGALITNGEESYFAPPVKDIIVKGTVCAGDSMVAGLVTGLYNELSLKDAFQRSVASATACVIQEASSVVTNELLMEILPRVEIQSI